ncbi:hypothetical protein C2G38_2048934 [Gigaspora rosea]|uniref:Uncharacterized protein n=1 Tax=Gigaspora rosea TaxID=44941 RepID=A0A397U0W4_9GLOM|nr:hypothetical protein C2G38_2048934 [Gigaspora rosea]
MDRQTTRYWESRKTWSAMVCTIRNLTRFIWIDVKNVNKNDEKEEILIEKKVAIKLLIGFAFAIKHYLREEEGNILEDVKPYLNIKSSLPGFKNLNRLEVITENQKPNTSSLSFQLVVSVGWITIAIMFFVSFILFGVERIAAEVQNHFGHGYNHFDLDYFCE